MKPSIINDIVSYPPKAGGNLIVATLSERKTIPLSTLYEMSGRVANGLLAHGIKPGDTIGILSDNRLEWVLLDLAALRIKVRTAGFDPGKFKTTTIKFTSGSTGIPKGLAATAGSIDSSLRSVQNIFNHGSGDRLLVFLPLSLLQQRYWIYSALKFGHDTILTNYQSAFVVMPQLNPTVVMGVPAFFDSARRHIERQSRDLATMVSQAKALFGTGIRYLWTGSAPAEVGMLQFFHQVGLPIYEGYGMNETCIVTKNHPAAFQLGSVGQVVDEKKVIIDRDGNVVVYSDYPVNTRYLYAQPGASEKMFTADGGVRTGDIGHIDEQGFLYIKGRSDNVIVLDNGKKIDVQPIEARMRNEPAIAECVIFSPKQTELVAIISPVGDAVEHESILQALENVNASGEKDEHIARIIIADPPFSIENGLLSSQFKPLRKMIFESYQEQLHATDKESSYAN
ncbi:fatty-acid-CoA ligase [Xenorhabdus indica]|nr:AMP-binding protein [Xenorhabdus indica]MBC8947261.1 fatty-acid-CoA ligase [Xenorhabdus indica]